MNNTTRDTVGVDIDQRPIWMHTGFPRADRHDSPTIGRIQEAGVVDWRRLDLGRLRIHSEPWHREFEETLAVDRCHWRA